MKQAMNHLGFGDNFSIKSIMSVQGLINGDMIYIYHHLKEGAKVALSKCGENFYGDAIYAVKYKQFDLGTVELTGVIKSFYQHENHIEAEISAISKDKYLPINKLDIAVSVSAMKKVG